MNQQIKAIKQKMERNRDKEIHRGMADFGRTYEEAARLVDAANASELAWYEKNGVPRRISF